MSRYSSSPEASPRMSLKDKEKIEIDFWVNSPTENPQADSLHNIVNKMANIPILLDCIGSFGHIFSSCKTILELGAGQGWASCVIKRQYPSAFVIATDISSAAVASIHKWEHIFQVKVDGVSACRSYAIPYPDSSLDCVFCFASAHHFAAHKRTLGEVARVLKPDSHCFYFYEPSSSELAYRTALWRVTRKRPEVPEDLLRFKRIQAMALDAGLECSLHFFPDRRRRGHVESLYYSILHRAKFLQSLLPCTINYQFKKFIVS